jgi:hypothetical protein
MVPFVHAHNKGVRRDLPPRSESVSYAGHMANKDKGGAGKSQKKTAQKSLKEKRLAKKVKGEQKSFSMNKE